MSIRSVCRWLVVAALFVAVGCQEGESGPTGNAPETQGTDVNGKMISLSQFKGKVVLIDFWATWCGYCVQEIPTEKQLQSEFSGRPFTILGVSRDNSREELASFLAQEKLPWPNIFDNTGAVTKQWGVSGFPTFVLVDHNGNIVKRWSGAGRMADIRSEVEKAVREAEKSKG